MTGFIIEQDRPRLDCWPVAGIATVCLKRLKARRTRWLPATNDRQMCTANAATHRKRTHIASVTSICRAIAQSSETGARLKTP